MRILLLALLSVAGLYAQDGQSSFVVIPPAVAPGTGGGNTAVVSCTGLNTTTCTIAPTSAVYGDGSTVPFLSGTVTFGTATTAAATWAITGLAGTKTLYGNGSPSSSCVVFAAGVPYPFSFDGTYVQVQGTSIPANKGVLASNSCGAIVAGIWKCTIITGDPGSASPVLADDNDSPVACQNDSGVDVTITAVSAWANAGSPTVTPILTGGSGTSVLTGALTAGTASWAAGTINGTVTLHSFSANGSTCNSTPCTIDSNITTAGGTAKYLVVQIIGTY